MTPRVFACLLLVVASSPLDLATPTALSASAARPLADVQPSVCQLFPIALSAQSVASATPGTPFSNLVMGTLPGQYGWLTWTGALDQTTLIISLAPPGNSQVFVDPGNPSATSLRIGSR